MVVAVVAMLKAVRAYVQHLGPINGVVLLVRAYSGVIAVTWLAGFLLHLLLLFLPCLGRGLVWEIKELGLDGFLFGQEKLCGPDGISGVLPLELLVFYHKQDLLVSGSD